MAAIKIATRGSKLALWQSEHVKASLMKAHPGLEVELNVISTKGDRVLDVALSKIGDKGLFTAELEASLRDGSSDIAVHSFKDLPTEMADDLAIHAVLEREDPRDLLIVRKAVAESSGAEPLALLKPGAVLGTSSLRRCAQALAQRPDLKILDLRGNVDTRLRKLVEGEYDGIMLAAAGLLRLEWVSACLAEMQGFEGADTLATQPLAPPRWLYASCQGAIAVQGRSGDQRVSDLMDALNHAPSFAACELERSFLATVEGGCKLPVAVCALPDASGHELRGAVFALDGKSNALKSQHISAADPAQAKAQAQALARDVLAAGGAHILSAIQADEA